MFDWLKKLFRPITPPPPAPKEQPFSIYERLEEKKNNAKKEKSLLKQTPIDWYSLTVYQEKKKSVINVFHPYRFDQTANLKSLKEERLRREAHELKVLETEVMGLLNSIENYIIQRKIDKAKQDIDVVRCKVSRIKETSVRQRYVRLQNSLSKLKDELEQEKLAQLAKEKRLKKEEDRKKKENEERKRKEKERREAEERKRRQEEADRLAEEARKKELAEKAEKERLEFLSTERKEDWTEFKNVLDNNGIQYLYHFTDKRNIPSIKRHGGLLSWYYCMQNNITIPCQGGDYDSQELDKKYGLEDYVRLSFCDDHPMAYRLKQSGSNIVILKIKVDVALLKDTLFSDINAADKLHSHGSGLEDLKKVDFNATKRHYVSKNDEDFKSHQAEVMVKTFIPLKYIINI